LRFLQGWEMFIRHSASANESLRSGMPKRLRRCYGGGYLHFITSSCYYRRPILGTAQRRSLFVELLEQVRRRYGFVVVGYVAMPEHFHLLISEPKKGTPSTVMQVLKQRFARKSLKRSRTRGDPSQANSGMKGWLKDTCGSGGSTIS
jgi:REP element-mobilizing transposase RayT